MRGYEGHTISEKLKYVESFLLSQEDYSEEQIPLFKHNMSMFTSQFKEKWSAASRTHETFIKKYETWLYGSFKLPCTVPLTSSGQPVKSFHESSERTKRRKTEALREDVDCEELVFAAKTKLRSCGKRDAAEVLSALVNLLAVLRNTRRPILKVL